MLLTVEQVTNSKSGKALRVKANGAWYGAKKDSGINAGMVIEAAVEDGAFGPWIGAYTPQAKSNSGNGHAAQSSSSPSSSSGSGAAAPAWSNFVSNQVAHAIAAGLITTPEQIKLWAAAAKQAYTEIQ